MKPGKLNVLLQYVHPQYIAEEPGSVIDERAVQFVIRPSYDLILLFEYL